MTSRRPDRTTLQSCISQKQSVFFNLFYTENVHLIDPVTVLLQREGGIRRFSLKYIEEFYTFTI